MTIMKVGLLQVFSAASILAAVLICIILWFYAREQAQWGFQLMLLVLLLVIYANIREKWKQVKKSQHKALDQLADKKEAGLMKAIGSVALIVAITVLALAWFYIREQFMWAVTLALLFLLVAGVIDIKRIFVDPQ